MATFRMTHDIDCDPERFWKIFFDTQFNEKLFKSLEFTEWNVVKLTEDENSIVRIVKAVPKMDLPGPVAKLVGSGFGYDEEGRFDRATKTFKYVVKASTMAEKLRHEGVVRCEDLGNGKCRRVADIIAEAKIFGIGGMFESALEKGYRIGWQKSADFINAYLKENP